MPRTTDPDIAYDRGYGDGMQQATREIWQFVRGNRGDDRWWDALADHLKKLDARSDRRIAEARAETKLSIAATV